MIVFDISALNGFKKHLQRGIGRFVSNFVRYAEKFNLKIRYFNFSDAGAFNHILSLLPKGQDLVRNHLVYFWNSLKLGSDDVALIPTQTDSPLFFRRDFLLIVWDLIPFKFPELYGALENKYRYQIARLIESSGIQRAKGILTCSPSTKKNLEVFFNIDSAKIKLFRLGLDDIFFQAESILESPFCSRFPDLSDYFLYYGGSDGRKNIDLIYSLAKHYPDDKFVLVTAPTNREKNLPNVLHLKPCSDEELVLFILRSKACLFPSLDEGFGYPVYEVSALGKPIIASKLEPYVSDLPEQWYAHPNVEDFSQRIDEIKSLKSDHLMDRLNRVKMKAKQFTWPNALEQFRSVIRELGYDL